MEGLGALVFLGSQLKGGLVLSLSDLILPSSLRGQLPTSLRVPALWLPLCRALCYTYEPSALPGLATLPAWLLLPQGELWKLTRHSRRECSAQLPWLPSPVRP